VDLALQLVAHGLADQRQRLGAPPAQPGAALVARDRPEPGGRLARILSAKQRTVRREKALLRRILRLDGVAQHEPADAVDHPPVLLEERGDPLPGRPLATTAGEGERAGAASC